ncbi:hypothetical protein PsAD14_04202 [Pseudovibrio sp. Ad14]|nr:hypothetical protein PsW74_04595 [Pseudovibrio sp. W74]KZL07187.1 hypothetical protein PsAD14_04202 [Pseudovibrio sp. Ad14]
MKDSAERCWSDADKRVICQDAIERTDAVAHAAKGLSIRKARLDY